MSHFHLIAGALAVAAGAGACADGVGPGRVAGTYALRTVNDSPVPLPGVYEPVSGTITLMAAGRAERRVRYRMTAEGTVREFAATGSFRLRGSVLELALREGDHVWTPQAELVGARITLRYPHPADGPDIVELYERR
ncbi:MAG: hypothetical protein Q8R92_17090 [Deltaproteobacteria bacterium]|nr:hypothetical protein [Deltaproteobacteria bacterium]